MAEWQKGQSERAKRQRLNHYVLWTRDYELGDHDVSRVHAEELLANLQLECRRVALFGTRLN